MDTKEGPPDGCRDTTAKLLTRVVAYGLVFFGLLAFGILYHV